MRLEKFFEKKRPSYVWRYVWKEQEMFFEDYDAGLEKHCRELESSARTITGSEEKELFDKFFGQVPEKMTEEALAARDQIINANTDLAVAEGVPAAQRTGHP